MLTDRIYDFFSVHRKWRKALLAALTAVLAALVCTLHFSEDISDFLPLGTREREQMSIYQNISGADKIVILFSAADSQPASPDRIAEAVGRFLDCLGENDTCGWCDLSGGGMNMETVTAVSRFVYDNAPYFMTDEDFARADSLLSSPDYVRKALAADRFALAFPSSSLVSEAIMRDPLGLFGLVAARLQGSGDTAGFELYDNCVFTPDMSRAVVILTSPFGNSETENNSRLLKILEKSSRQMREDFPDVEAHITGGPAIAVGNSERIKKDSILAVSLSAVLVLLLLIYSFRSAKNILLTFLSVGWGLLFALGGMAVFRDSVSLIVIGISSVILGIAVNYPLHLVAHLAHRKDRRTAMREIVSPLVVGNITTVGAFLALVPLRSAALRDLGLFASLLLVGTILFVLVFLPHYVAVSGASGAGRKAASRDGDGIRDGGDGAAAGNVPENWDSASAENAPHGFLDRLAAFSPEKSRVLVIAAVLVTAVLSFFSLRTEFDSDLTNINYMTAEQRRDLDYFSGLLEHGAESASLGASSAAESATAARPKTLYVYARAESYDSALAAFAPLASLTDSLENEGLVSRRNAFDSFVVTPQMQRERLDRWRGLVERHRPVLTAVLAREASEAGFSKKAFAKFAALIDRTPALEPQGFDFFAPLSETVFLGNSTTITASDAPYCVVDALNVAPDDIPEVKKALGDSCFDIAEINGAMTGSLSDNFNYIGWACSLIVFFFLWFSFGRLEPALISFLPMAVSWIWILGLMTLLGIKFNIVNIILATFIFGQGDDYTIFITEGCQYEYARRRPILLAYKSSILQSAAIMFVGMGTLIVARHPALRSLAEVTVIGMFSVVLMACLIPPLLFRWLTLKKGEARKYPLTFRTLLLGSPRTPMEAVPARYAYKGKEIERAVHRGLKAHGEEIIAMTPAPSGRIELTDDAYGALAILAALSHPEAEVLAHIPDGEKRLVASVAADGFVGNLVIVGE